MPGAGDNIHQQLRPRKSRTKSGCLCCRIRKKKCDEVKPVCTFCKRLDLICSWPESENEFAWRKRMGLSASEPSKDACKGPVHARNTSPRNARRPEIPTQLQESILLSPQIPDPSAPPSDWTAPRLRLLQVYIEQIVPYILCLPKEFQNPLVHDVIPMACSDELIMNIVLALGGSTRDVGDKVVNKEDERQALQSYGEAIKELKLGLTRWATGTLRGNGQDVRMLLAIMLLCHYECIRGNEEGHLFHHIRAARVFAPVVYASRQETTWSSLVGVLLETHAYFELCSSMRLLPDDIDIQVALQSVVPQLDRLRQFNTFGAMFGAASDIFKLVPEICQLALCRRMDSQDTQCEETFYRLKATITQWESGDDEASCADADPFFTQGKVAAGMISQNALLLFLMSSYYPPGGDEEDYVRKISQPLVDGMNEVLPILRKSVFANTCFWPVLVTALYATTETQRRQIIDYFPPFMPLLVRALEVLHWVWDGPDEVIGLPGLARVIESHCTSYCFG